MDRFDDKAREIVKRCGMDGANVSPRVIAAILRAAVELRAGSDAPVSDPAAPRDWSNEEVVACAIAARQSNSALREMVGMPVNKATMDDVRAVLAGERSVDPEWDRAVLSHAATLRPPAAVPSPTTQRHTGPGHFTSPRGEVASDCGYCMGEAPAAVPASPQAETRGDLLERLVRRASNVAQLWADLTSQEMFGESIAAAVEEDALDEFNDDMQSLRNLLAEYAAPPVQAVTVEGK